MEKMQKIPLRVFYRTIDDLILNQQSDAAISRAKYLLQKFPKNLSVYRLLGKAFLDKQDFENAEFIFNKILAIDPDDFVSHIGLSIISQNFGDLEKAQISMMLAYELQPSNESLQNEVKRLHESRTDAALNKIRMTRGTLIKMYSRSQLADQTIAEARLGIQESPDRVDYKIHLAKMLDTSGKEIDAIQTCMEIIQILPYCYAALLILFKRISPKNDSSATSIFKSRLSELDPYFTYMGTETNSVEDIPDISIMIEERSEPENTIDNLNTFINNEWEIPASEIVELKSIDTNEDWNSIISEAVSNEALGSALSDSTYEEIILPFEKDSNFSDNITNPIENMIKGSEEDYFSSNINSDENNPLVLSGLSVTSDEIRPEFEKTDGTNTQYSTNKHIEDKSKNNLKELFKSKLTGSKASNNVPNWVFSENETDDTSEMESLTPDGNHLNNSLPSNFGVDGMTDHNAPISSNLSTISKNINESFDWITENSEETNHMQVKTTNVLDDTQRIYIISDNSEEIMNQAFNSIEKEDYTFAHLCFSKLIQNDFKLNQVAELLENYVNENPKTLDLWLILAEIYKRLGLEEKTLSALVRAQNNLSFK
jgi:tetratricopeptide (TPR) repeat protein